MAKGQPLITGVKRVINVELKTGEVVTMDEYINRHGEPAPGRTPLHGWYTMKSVEPLPVEAPPRPPSVSEGNLREAARRYLMANYRGSLYGRAWSLPGSMEGATQHVVETVQGVLRAAHELEQEQE